MQYKYVKAAVCTPVIPAVRTKHEDASHKRGFRPHGSQDLAEHQVVFGVICHGATTSVLLLRCSDLGALFALPPPYHNLGGITLALLPRRYHLSATAY